MANKKGIEGYNRRRLLTVLGYIVANKMDCQTKSSYETTMVRAMS